MTEKTVITKTTGKKTPTALWMLMLTFAVPIIAAYAYFFFGDHLSMSNHGDLITPVIDIVDLQLTDENNKPILHEELTHKWSMLFVVGKDCNDACNKGLYNMRQINIALGKNQDRFQHMMIHADAMSQNFTKLVAIEHHAAFHAYSPRETLLNAFSAVETELPSNSIYIMDPIGNIMMRFSPGISPKLILKDLNHLLKVSQIG